MGNYQRKREINVTSEAYEALGKCCGTANETGRFLTWLFTGDEETFQHKMLWRMSHSSEIFYDEEMECRIAHLKQKKTVESSFT